MTPRNARVRKSFRVEFLEDRNAPSHAGGLGAAFEAVHHHRGGHAGPARAHEVSMLRRGQDDPAGHNQNDLRQGRGRDDLVNHNRVDLRQGRGRDDAANHDQNDLRQGRGQDDAANHNAADDRGGHGRDDRAGHR